MIIEEMIEELEQNFEAAGFKDYYNQVLKGKSDEEISKIYEDYKKYIDKPEEYSDDNNQF